MRPVRIRRDDGPFEEYLAEHRRRTTSVDGHCPSCEDSATAIYPAVDRDGLADHTVCSEHRGRTAPGKGRIAPTSSVLDGAIAQAREWSASSGDDWRLSKAQVVALADAADAGRVARAAVRAVLRLLVDATEGGAKVVRVADVRDAIHTGGRS